MILEIGTLREKDLPEQMVDDILMFIKTGNPSYARGSHVPPDTWGAEFVGKVLVSELRWNDTVRLLLHFFIHLSEAAGPAQQLEHGFLAGAFRYLLGDESTIDPEQAKEIIDEIETRHQALAVFIRHYLEHYSYGNNWEIGDISNAEEPFASPAANLIYRGISEDYTRTPEVLSQHEGLFSALAVHRPRIVRAWCLKSTIFDSWKTRPVWRVIVNASPAYDESCVAFCEAIAVTQADDAFAVIRDLNVARNGAYAELELKLASQPRAAQGHEALQLLLEQRDSELMGIMTAAFSIPDAGDYSSCIEGPAYGRLFSLIPDRWDKGGRELLSNLVANFNNYKVTDLLSIHLPLLGKEHAAALREGFLRHLERRQPKERPELWAVVAASQPEAFTVDFREMLVGKSKPLREISAGALAGILGLQGLQDMIPLLGARKGEERLGAALFMEKLGHASAITPLQHALSKETSELVRTSLHGALKACGASDEAAPDAPETSFESLSAIETKGLKLPKTNWLDPEALHSQQEPIPKQAIVFMIAKQSKHKTIEAAPDILPLLALIDREKSAPFAARLVEGFLNSEQAAADRWALTLGGLLGDNRIIPLLLSRINDWCENSRHKLAEYAAQAISLLPGNEPLMVLDTLSTRYRSKFKNVGKACAEAFATAAAARGITPDELGDMVVPDFGFDADGVRRFDWEGGGASAELGAEFKLSWFDPETDKSWKALPASAPEEIKTEVKTLTKLLKEAVKGQTARLEMTLVRQRRWPVARWRELYENHPLLKSFASSLVWGIYDASGTLLRTFRRYPNGLLANAKGDLEELPEADTQLGMVHPLELDAETLDAWRGHLARFKVKQPFPQIERPIELLDPLHGNRREISLTKDKKVGAGTFKSRSEKRGWIRGSVVDAGGIASVYKPFPGAGFEAILVTDNYWVGIDPMDTVELGGAYFVKAESVERGSYTYDDPGPDDTRVLRFDQVPAVVWSETLSDLKAIIGGA